MAVLGGLSPRMRARVQETVLKAKLQRQVVHLRSQGQQETH